MTGIAQGQREIFRAVAIAALVILFCVTGKLTGSTPTPRQDQAPAPLMVTLTELPDGTVGEFYGVTITATGGKRTYDFSATGLPDGLSVSRNSDRIGGKPTTAGTFSPVITVKDSTRPTANVASVTLKLTILAAH